MYPKVFEINGRPFEVDYLVAKGATSSAKITRDKVIIRLSRYSFGWQRERAVAKFLKWAKKKLENMGGTDFVEPVYEDGGRICTHNKIYEINVLTKNVSSIRGKLIDGYLIEISLSETFSEVKKRSAVKILSEKLIIKDQGDYLRNVIDEINEMYFKEQYGLVRFKRMNSRFGSCSSRRNINIAFRLLLAPREVFRYVCVHELAHLKEFNHSKKFWNLVSIAMPDYKENEKWLRSNGFMLG